jgi:hypothetical protein
MVLQPNRFTPWLNLCLGKIEQKNGHMKITINILMALAPFCFMKPVAGQPMKYLMHGFNGFAYFSE